MRLDVLLVEKGRFSTREKAKAAIMAGLVRVDGETVVKAGTKVPCHAKVEVDAPLHPYVSRGGLKLEKALRVFEFEMDGAVVVDVGASTGGFTVRLDGARHVYAVDVGYGQLAWKLRQDPRVAGDGANEFPARFAGRISRPEAGRGGGRRVVYIVGQNTAGVKAGPASPRRCTLPR